MMGTICFGIHMHITFELAIKIADIAKAAKAGNMRAKPQEADIHVEGSGQIRACQVYQMQGWGRDAENDFTHPELISPKTTELFVEGNTFRFVFPGESFTIIRMET